MARLLHSMQVFWDGKMFKAFFLLSLCVPFSCETSSQSKTTSLVSPRDSGGWTSGKQSFFDIALTALAFLSFGVFLINLLINALLFTSGLTPGITSTGPIITMTGDYINPGTMDGTGGGGTAGFFRGKREIAELKIDSTVSANILAETVIKSIDAMVHRYECLPHVFCEGNRQAQVIGHGFQYLMPLFSFSSSYLGERLGFHEHLPSHLDAILHGVSEYNCQSQFPTCAIR